MVEAFLRALAGSFERNRASLPVVEVAILVLVALGVLLQLASLVRRFWDQRTRLRRLSSRLGISPADLSFAKALARRAGVAPISLFGRLDLFERATARALGVGGNEALAAAEAIRRLRRALGFDRLAAHTPLLTTRELAPGTAVEAGPLHGQAFDVGETCFSVRFPLDSPGRPGEEIALSLVHAREARYELRCLVREERAAEGGARVLVLSHDEEPRRLQQREHARVMVRGAIALTALAPRPVDSGPRLDLVARLVDVSGGGALVSSREPLPVGMLALATFTLGGVRFEKFQAVVVSCEEAGGQSRVRLEWRRLSEGMRDRLVSVVMRLERPEEGEGEHSP